MKTKKFRQWHTCVLWHSQEQVNIPCCKSDDIFYCQIYCILNAWILRPMRPKRQSLWADSARKTSPGEYRIVLPIFDSYEMYFIFGTGELGIRRHTTNIPLLIPTWYTIFYISYIKLSSSTCFERHPLIFRRSMMLIVHVCGLWYSLQVAVLCTC